MFIIPAPVALVPWQLGQWRACKRTTMFRGRACALAAWWMSIGDPPRPGKTMNKNMINFEWLPTHSFHDYINSCPVQTVTPTATMVWAERVYFDFGKQAPPKCPTKQKELGTKYTCWTPNLEIICFKSWRPDILNYGAHVWTWVQHPEKMAQRTVPQMRDLMEVACLWVAISEPLRLHLGDAAFTQCKEMFFAGILGRFGNPSKTVYGTPSVGQYQQNHVHLGLTSQGLNYTWF